MSSHPKGTHVKPDSVPGRFFFLPQSSDLFPEGTDPFHRVPDVLTGGTLQR